MSENISKPHVLVVGEFVLEELAGCFEVEHLDNCPTQTHDAGPFGSYISYECEVGQHSNSDGVESSFRHQDEPPSEWDSRQPLAPGRHVIEAWSSYDPPHPGGGGEWDGGLRLAEEPAPDDRSPRGRGRDVVCPSGSAVARRDGQRGRCLMPALEGRDGVLGVVPDAPDSPWWACPRPSNDPRHNVPYIESGDCSWHEIPLVEIGPDDMEVP